MFDFYKNPKKISPENKTSSSEICYSMDSKNRENMRNQLNFFFYTVYFTNFSFIHLTLLILFLQYCVEIFPTFNIHTFNIFLFILSLLVKYFYINAYKVSVEKYLWAIYLILWSITILFKFIKIQSSLRGWSSFDNPKIFRVITQT